MTLREKIVDAATGQETFRDFTADEIAQHEAEKLLTEKKFAEIKAQQAAKAEQRAAILERLGLTEEEAQLLLG